MTTSWYENGETSLCLVLNYSGSEQTDAIIPVLCQRLAQQARAEINHLTDVIPGRDSLTLVTQSAEYLQSLRDQLEKLLDSALKQPQQASGNLHEIPVCYDTRLGNDIDQLAEILSLTSDDIIRRHLNKTYQLDMLGFLPGFLYLSGLDRSLIVPRKSTPAISVSAGAVAIADNMSGIYSLPSPGGWWILGRTPVKLFNLDQYPPVKVQPLDQIRFNQIDYDEWLRQAND